MPDPSIMGPAIGDVLGPQPETANSNKLPTQVVNTVRERRDLCGMFIVGFALFRVAESSLVFSVNHPCIIDKHASLSNPSSRLILSAEFRTDWEDSGNWRIAMPPENAMGRPPDQFESFGDVSLVSAKAKDA